MPRAEYIKCIKSSTNNLSFCGRYIKYEYSLVDLEHALACIETESRLVPCKKCLKLAQKENDTRKTQLQSIIR